MRGNPQFRLAMAACVVLVHAGCGSGVGHVESFLKEIAPGDAVAVAGLLILNNVPDVGWSTRVAQQGENRYRIAVERMAWSGIGDGEFGRRFGEAARVVAAERECRGFSVLAYAERYEGAIVGTKRIAEGLVECR